MVQFDLQRFALEFQADSQATVKVPVNMNEDGQYASESEIPVGTKSVSINATKGSATYGEIMYGTGGGNASHTAPDGKAGVVLVFFDYILGAIYDKENIKRTINESVVNVSG